MALLDALQQAKDQCTVLEQHMIVSINTKSVADALTGLSHVP